MKPIEPRGYPTICLVIALSVLLSPTRVPAQDQQQFASPEEAVNALKAAVAAQDTNALHRIFGAAGQALVSADVVEAANERAIFAERLTQGTQLVRDSDTKETLEVGPDHWPFPIPLLRNDSHWYFDTEAGRQEILNRRIGANEMGAIRVCLAYVDAQREYASQDRNQDDVLEYARQLRSNPGTHDGLYWPAKAGEELSPLGPLIAQAHGEGYRRQARIMTDTPSPYHGYYFRILTRQGKHAPGGKYSYIINGHMIGGFALVAWPAQWGNTGVMTFIVNQRGKVYQKNLGPDTASIASSMTVYDPDPTWTPANAE